ncbi:MAG: cobalamin-dependent protein [archaeon]|nr:cobalamin B12-binding domain-containing protein [archaeon]MCP8318134.1 cobalamin-dependent protein [archaeon]MCP8319517.1 cobalamin-dependent protein [archaeon]
MSKAILDKLKNAVIEGDSDVATTGSKDALKSGISAKEAVDALASGMGVIAQKFEDAEIWLPQVMVAADAMIAGIKVLEPELAKAGASAKLGTVVIGTVQGDIHDIGKTLVGIMLRGAGFEVHDLGRDVKIPLYWETAKSVNADLVAVSALMSTTTLFQRNVVLAGKEEGLYPKIKVIVGGACASPEWAEKIGASYAQNAGEALKVVKAMMGRR